MDVKMWWENPPHQPYSRDFWIWLPAFQCLTIWLVFNAFSFFLIGTTKHVMFFLPVGNSTKASHKNLHLCNKLLYDLLLMNKVPENVQPFCTLNTKQMEVWKELSSSREGKVKGGRVKLMVRGLTSQARGWTLHPGWQGQPHSFKDTAYRQGPGK